MILKENSLNHHLKKSQKLNKSKFLNIFFLIEFKYKIRLSKIKKPKEDEPNFINMANLKQSTNKFALKEEQKDDEKINFRDQVQLKSAKEHKEEE
jgi:hypothetical protein